MTAKPKAVKDVTEEEKFQNALNMEQEFSRYRHQFKVMEREKKGGLGVQHQRQIRVMKKLKEEDAHLLDDLEIAASKTKMRQDNEMFDRLKALLDEHNGYTTATKEVHNQIREISACVYNLDKEVAVQRVHSIAVTDSHIQARMLEGQKVLEKLENRLDVQVKLFCSILNDNHKLRGEIKHLLKERIRFNLLWNKILTNLTFGKKFMLDLIEQATLAYDQREEFCVRLQMLRVRAKTDFKMDIEEAIRIECQTDAKRNLHNFLNIKNQKRVTNDLTEKYKLKREIKKSDMEKMMQKYEAMLTEITEFAGGEHVKKIAENFVKQEEENFANCLNVIKLNKEMELMCRDLEQFAATTDETRELTNARRKQQMDRLDSLKSTLEDIMSEIEEGGKELKNNDDRLTKITTGIEQIFKLVKCTNDPIIILLGDKEKVTANNVHFFLRLIESQVMNLMSVAYKDQLRSRSVKQLFDTQQAGPLSSTDQIARSSPCPLCVQHEQVSDVIDELQFAFTRKEIQKKLKTRLALGDSHILVHNVSACILPESRQIMQRRYQ